MRHHLITPLLLFTFVFMTRLSASPNSSLSSLSCPQKRRHSRYRRHTTNQREDERQRKRYRRLRERNAESPNEGTTTVSSITTRTSPSLLMNLFPSPTEEIDDEVEAAAVSPRPPSRFSRNPTALNPLSQLESLATSHIYSPPRNIDNSNNHPPMSVDTVEQAGKAS